MSICLYKAFDDWKVVNTPEEKSAALSAGYFESPADALAHSAILAEKAAKELKEMEEKKIVKKAKNDNG